MKKFLHLKDLLAIFLLSVISNGCIIRNGSEFSDLYPMFNFLWMLFLVLGIGTGIYYIFGKDDNKRKNSGLASIICIMLFVGLLVTA